ncbi:porphobilinogen deaminase [Methanocaldococcus bathoardescens]|uniref:Probable porphobilinogen deaminase n=1 Tax=Methanocaldococcus bathoardescens TaxID=1301915 RepID=A0A076LBV2_9EURY|nr:hydroxymethylbilane synthase [Methanocaldococcus bathoardescens]AIJ05631.1 porphobilinogen deaminase [Methanocaldococcus bathoardescens]
MIRIGTRGSKLALYQANKVAELLKNLGYDVEIKIIKTTGDRVLDKKLSDIGIGVFTKELDLAMLNNEIDIAVHSLKDIPTIWNENLMVGAVLERDSYYDLLIWNKDIDFDENSVIVIGTSSLRRRAFLKFLYPNAKFELLRGNVDTRLRKLKEGLYDAIVLSEAGIVRLGINLDDFNYKRLDILPAPAQGIIAVACKRDDKEMRNILKEINHEKTYLESLCERAALNEFGGGCSVPFGALAIYDEKNEKLKLDAGVVINDELKKASGEIKCKVNEINKAIELGKKIGVKLKN